MVKQAIVLCGGKGKRLNGDVRYQPTEEVPKPLVEVGGRPFITYSINMLKGIGIEDIVLSVGYMKEKFGFLAGRGVRLEEARSTPNRSVIFIPGLHSLFLLLNGDCFPVMDWRAFCNTESPRVAVKIVGRDAGVAIVSRAGAAESQIDCGNIEGMVGQVENYTILGGLHIGTYQGLARARLFMDTVVFGA